MRERTSSDLQQIVRRSEESEWTQEALAAARCVLEERGVSPDLVAQDDETEGRSAASSRCGSVKAVLRCLTQDWSQHGLTTRTFTTWADTPCELDLTKHGKYTLRCSGCGKDVDAVVYPALPTQEARELSRAGRLFAWLKACTAVAAASAGLVLVVCVTRGVDAISGSLCGTLGTLFGLCSEVAIPLLLIVLADERSYTRPVVTASAPGHGFFAHVRPSGRDQGAASLLAGCLSASLLYLFTGYSRRGDAPTGRSLSWQGIYTDRRLRARQRFCATERQDATVTPSLPPESSETSAVYRDAPTWRTEWKCRFCGAENSGGMERCTGCGRGFHAVV